MKKEKIKIIFRPICWIKGIYWTLRRMVTGNFDGIYIDGCDYVEQSNGDLICKKCGKIIYNKK